TPRRRPTLSGGRRRSSRSTRIGTGIMCTTRSSGTLRIGSGGSNGSAKCGVLLPYEGRVSQRRDAEEVEAVSELLRAWLEDVKARLKDAELGGLGTRDAVGEDA